jgi:serine/threonine-protein kinase HipA
MAQGKIAKQFSKLAENAQISEKSFQEVMSLIVSKSEVVEKMVTASFLNGSAQKKYFQSYLVRLKQL